MQPNDTDEYLEWMKGRTRTPPQHFYITIAYGEAGQYSTRIKLPAPELTRALDLLATSEHKRVRIFAESVMRMTAAWWG